MRTYSCQLITGPGSRRCGSPATRRLTCTFSRRPTGHFYYCARDSRWMRETLADPLFAYLGSTGTSEILISEHLPFVGALCVGALQQASLRQAPATAPAPVLTPECLPSAHANHLLAAVMNFVNGCPGLTAPGLDVRAVGRAWWIAHHEPLALHGALDPEARRAIPHELLDHIAAAAHYGSGLFTSVERDEATGTARGIYPPTRPLTADRRP